MKYCTFIFAKQDNNKELFEEKRKTNTFFNLKQGFFFFNFFNTTLKQRASKQQTLFEFCDRFIRNFNNAINFIPTIQESYI